jgi:glutathione S-transferase
MYKLYYYPGNANLAPHMVLEEAGAPHELVLVDRNKNAQKRPDYLKLNPNGRIPTLVDGELVMFESAAICLHLLDKHPEAKLAPAVGTDDRAHFYKWLIYLTNTIQTEFLTFYYPERHTTDSTAIASVKAMADRRLCEMFQIVDKALEDRPYLAGERVSAADLYLLMLARWGRNLSKPARDWPNIRRVLDPVLSRPAVQRTIEIEGIPAPFM